MVQKQERDSLISLFHIYVRDEQIEKADEVESQLIDMAAEYAYTMGEIAGITGYEPKLRV